MNDNELDQMLDGWKAPAAPTSLREGVRAGFRGRFPRASAPRNWWMGSFLPRAGAIAAAGLFVLVLTRAAAAVLWAPAAAAHAAVTMETKTWEYSADGSAIVTVSTVGYDKEGQEIPLSRVFPNEPLKTMGQRAIDWIVSLHMALAEYIHGGQFGESGNGMAALREAGCAVDPVVGRETILNHQTVEVQNIYRDQRRRTAWMAPNMGCFALKYVVDVRQADGTFRPVFQNQALAIYDGK